MSYRRRVSLVFGVSLSVFSGAVTGATINVPGDQPTIQACIDAAVSGVDQCVVAPGTYVENINFNGKAITVRSSSPSSPAVVAATVIDGNGVGSVVTCANAEGADTVLSGFTITGGDAVDGGGMHNFVASPTVINCAFVGNTATNGGGIFGLASIAKVTRCSFSGNSADYGGGAHFSSGSPALTNSSFLGNSATSDGGGLYGFESNPTIRGCSFMGNTAAIRGGGFSNNGGNGGKYASIIDCEFRENMAADGGGLANFFHTNPTTQSCTFAGNTSQRGGGIYYEHMSYGTITGCRFLGNVASLLGGGIYAFQLCSPVVTNCEFTGNSTDGLGGAYYNFEDCTPTITNSTFSRNSASDGGAIYNEDVDVLLDDPTIVNCILWDNSPNEISLLGATPVVHQSNVRGGVPAEAIDGGGNLDVDPLFVDDDGADDIVGTDDDNLRLIVGSPWSDSPLVGSPCIDAGDSNAPGLAGIRADLVGDYRFTDDPQSVDTGFGTTPIVDLGAYETPVERTSRYLRFPAPPVVAGVTQEILRVRIVQLEDLPVPSIDVLYVGPPSDAPEEDSSQPGLTFRSARLQCEPYAHTWTGESVVAAYGGEIIPNSTYELQRTPSDCPNFESDESCWTDPMTVVTSHLGDVVPPFMPDTLLPDFRDINAVVQKYLSTGGPIKAVAQVQPNVVDPSIALSSKDLSAYVSSFLGASYQEQFFVSGPCVCPSSVVCGATACLSNFACGDGLCTGGLCTDSCGRCTP